MEFLVNEVGVPAPDVLYGVTGLAAEAIGMEDRIGVLQPGKLADIVIVDGDPFTNIENMQRIHSVVKQGEVVVRGGSLSWPEPQADGRHSRSRLGNWSQAFDYTSSRTGSSRRRLTSTRNRAPSAPSTVRWSADRVAVII